MLFFCLTLPLSMMLFIFKGQARKILVFLLIGIFMCLFAGQINGLILNETELTVRFLTVNITPIVEEILKAIPIIFIAFLFKPDRQFLLEGSIALGVGFATMENTGILFDSAFGLTAETIIARGLGAGMMHGISALAVGFSITFASHDKKLSYTGTVAALSTAIIYHSIYNIMVQSAYPLLGILLPMITFIPIIIAINGRRRDSI